MKCYKITDGGMRTHQGFQYTLGTWAPQLNGAGELCTNSWYYVYDSPRLAALFHPLHLQTQDGRRLFECTYDGRRRTLDDNGIKRGVVTLRPDKELERGSLGVSTEQRVRFALYAALDVYIYIEDDDWRRWAEAWLTGKSHSTDAAEDMALAVCGRREEVGKLACAEESASFALEHAASAAAAGNVWHSLLDSWLKAAEAAQSAAGVITRNAAYWVGLLDRAIADEDKYQEEHVPA